VIRVFGMVAACLLLMGPWPGAAQTRSPAAPAQPSSPAPEPPPKAYEPELLQLAEVMGALAVLRELCGGADARDWPRRMAELLEVEGNTAGRRERLAGAYNRGFTSFARVHRGCTPTAEAAARRLAEDGDRLTRGLAGRFGG
jgi:uncharacterized protein (TIGR02301 family)